VYFSLVFQVMSRTYLRFTPAAPSIVYSDYKRDLIGQFSSIYTFCPFLSVIHARGSTQFVHLSVFDILLILMIGNLPMIFFFLLMVVGGPIVLIVLPIIIIISFLNIFQGSGTPILRALIFFFQPLRGENCLVVPPVGIVLRVLHYMKCQHAAGTLVVPLWPSAHF